MKAPPEAQQRLLDLQEIDTTLDQLEHRRGRLPELAEIKELTTRGAQMHDAIVAAETEARDVTKEQTKAEGDVDQVRSRAERDQARLDSGQVGSPKELENLQSEVASLGHRQAELEDVVLEVMERREAAEGKLREHSQRRDEIQAKLAELEQRRDEAYGELDAQAAVKKEQRAALIGDIPDELLALYEKLRAQTGVGAAALHRGRCEGCHLALTTVDLNRVRGAAPDEVVRCEECRRILIRPPETDQ